MSLPGKPISSSPWRSKPWAHQEKMQKDSQINFTDSLSHWVFLTCFFPTIPFFGLQVLGNSNPNRSFIFFGCICLLNRIPNLPSTGIPSELFHPPVNKWRHQTPGKRWHRSQDGARNVERKPIQPHRLRFSDRGHSITLIQTICHIFPKIPQNCDTFAIKFDDPPKQNCIKKITGLQRETLSNWWLNQFENVLVKSERLPKI